MRQFPPRICAQPGCEVELPRKRSQRSRFCPVHRPSPGPPATGLDKEKLRIRKARYARKRYARMRAAGICITHACGRKNDGSIHCTIHRLELNKRNRRRPVKRKQRGKTEKKPAPPPPPPQKKIETEAENEKRGVQYGDERIQKLFE